MDPSGRVHERILLRELGWNPGHRLDMDTLHDLIIIATAADGHHAVDPRGAINLPATFRRLCNITYGTPLVLAAAIPEQVMIIHPSTLVAHLIATHYTTLNHTALIQTERVPTVHAPANEASP